MNGSAVYVGCGLAQAFVLLVKLTLWLTGLVLLVLVFPLWIATAVLELCIEAIGKRFDALDSDLEALDRKMR